MVKMANAKQPTKRKPGRPKAPNPKRPSVSLKGSVEWREWLNELANFKHMPATILIDQALLAYAEASGFEKPMPKR